LFVRDGRARILRSGSYIHEVTICLVMVIGPSLRLRRLGWLTQ
jgi:hypothetical protein